jgi:nickel transport protein
MTEQRRGTRTSARSTGSSSLSRFCGSKVRPPKCQKTFLLTTFFSALLLVPATAEAHKLNVFATVSSDGKTIEGNAFFRGGGKAQNATVTAFDPSGKELGRTTTDAEGDFHLSVAARCDVKLVVDAGDGHGETFNIPAAEFSKDPPAAGAEPAENPPATAAVPASSGNSSTSSADANPDVSTKINALHNQIVQLRKDLNAAENRLRFRDILGGIGFILGLSGAAFYFLGSRRHGPPAKSPSPSGRGPG